MFSNNKFVLFVRFVVNNSFIYAQEDAVKIEIQSRYIQRLSWTAHEDALRYEVEIERETDGVYSRFLLERTEESSIHISLPYGNYRFRVIPYDLFNRQGIITEYQYIEINQAASERNEFAKRDGVLFNFYSGAYWLTHFNIHGEKDWVSAPSQFLSGASFRLGLVTSNLSIFNVGLEIVPAWYSINSLFNDNEAQSFLLEGNFLLQKDFYNRNGRPMAAVVLRTGVGINLSYDDEPIEMQNETAFYVNMGVSFIWLFEKYFYIEAGANYSYLFAIEYPTGRIRPFVGTGVKFGN